MDDAIRTAFHHSQVIDLTTTGRKTGRRRRIQIFRHDDDGRMFITGMPLADRTRNWIDNIDADLRVVVHLKRSVVADIPATARRDHRPGRAAAAHRDSREALGSYRPRQLGRARPAHPAQRRWRCPAAGRRPIATSTSIKQLINVRPAPVDQDAMG